MFPNIFRMTFSLKVFTFLINLSIRIRNNTGGHHGQSQGGSCGGVVGDVAIAGDGQEGLLLHLHVEGAGECVGGGQPTVDGTRHLVLKHPEDGVKPGFRKSRKKRKDGMMQTSLVNSSGGSFSFESERGLKRVWGDQMGGPVSRKKARLENVDESAQLI